MTKHSAPTYTGALQWASNAHHGFEDTIRNPLLLRGFMFQTPVEFGPAKRGALLALGTNRFNAGSPLSQFSLSRPAGTAWKENQLRLAASLCHDWPEFLAP